MSDGKVGYLDFDGKFVHFTAAQCQFGEGQLDVEAEGAKCKLHLFGIPFPKATSVAELSHLQYGPAHVTSDPIAEGGVETKSMWLSFTRVTVKCGLYNADEAMLKVSLQADVCDAESGRTGFVDAVVRCQVVESLW